MRPYSPGGLLNTFASAVLVSEPPQPSRHRLRRGLPGYLIPFAPHAFVSQRQYKPSTPISPLAFLLISTHSTAPPRVPCTPTCLKKRSSLRSSPVKPGDFTQRLHFAYTRFKPSNTEQRLPPSSYRGCWHEVSRDFLWVRSIRRSALSSPDSSLHPERLHPTRGVAASGFRPLRNIRYCSPPWRSGQCLSPDVAGQPLSPATRRCLGEPLPHQQADRRQAAPVPINL